METKQRHKTIDDSQRWTFRIADLHQRTGISESEIRRAIYAGELPAWKYRNRVWLIDAKDAMAWIEGARNSQVA